MSMTTTLAISALKKIEIALDELETIFIEDDNLNTVKSYLATAEYCLRDFISAQRLGRGDLGNG